MQIMRTRKSERITVPIALVTVALLVGVATYRISLLSNFSESIPVIVLDVDLERGLSWTQPETLKFPPRRLNLTCHLPGNSSGIEYRVELSAGDGKHLIDVGKYIVKNGRLGRAIEIQLDLRGTAQGNYVLQLISPEVKILRYPVRVLA